MIARTERRKHQLAYAEGYAVAIEDAAKVVDLQMYHYRSNGCQNEFVALKVSYDKIKALLAKRHESETNLPKGTK